jgi:hypothetical protein
LQQAKNNFLTTEVIMKNLIRFGSFIPLLSLFLFLTSPFGSAQNMDVAGAGATVVNGIYLLDGIMNGKNKYTQDVPPLTTEHLIYWNSGTSEWYIAPTEDASNPYYTVGVDVPIPPSSGWSSAGKGFDPAPTVTDTPLPVELSSFSAHFDGEVINLKWRTETEVNNYGFDIERSVNPRANQKEWSKIGFIEGHGNSNSPKDYSFVDSDLSMANIIYYRLKQIDNDGTYEYSHEVEISFISPDKYSLGQNYPNPFNPSTKIHYKIAQSEFVNLSVYNVLGKEAAVLVNEIQSPGTYSVVFSADNLPGGVYFYKLETQNFVQTSKMLLIK